MVLFRKNFYIFLGMGLLLVPLIHSQLLLPPLPTLPTIAQIFAILTLNLLQFLNLNVFDNLTPISTTNFMTLPTVGDTVRTLYYSFGIYCPLAQVQTWTCGQKCVDSGGTDNTVIQVYEDTVQQTRGLTIVNNPRSEIIIAFRGSYQAQNFLEDAVSVVLVPLALTGGTNVQVSQGFLLAAQSQYETMVLPNLRNQLAAHPGYNVVITGHSLGAAMAELTFAMLKNSTEFGSNSTLSLFKYGSPRVGNIGFASWMNSQNSSVIRVVNKADIFSHIFLNSEGYVHSGNEYWRAPNNSDIFCNPNLYEDPACSNSLGPSYNTNDHLTYLGIPKAGCA